MYCTLKNSSEGKSYVSVLTIFFKGKEIKQVLGSCYMGYGPHFVLINRILASSLGRFSSSFF